MVDLDPKMKILDIIELYPQTEDVFNKYSGGQEFDKNSSVESFCIDNSIPFFTFWKELTLKTKENRCEEDIVQSDNSIIPLQEEENNEKSSKVNVNECWKIARNDLRGYWGRAAWMTFIMGLYTCFWLIVLIFIYTYKLHFIFGLLCSIIITIHLIGISYKYQILFLEHHCNRKVSLSMKTLLVGYTGYNIRDFLTRILTTLLLQGLYVYLWYLLLIVPGIMKAMSYALTPYILREYPELSGNRAIELSMAMMQGHKMKMFTLCLKFIVCYILGFFTFGITDFWLIPSFYATMANFYEQVKSEYRARM